MHTAIITAIKILGSLLSTFKTYIQSLNLYADKAIKDAKPAASKSTKEMHAHNITKSTAVIMRLNLTRRFSCASSLLAMKRLVKLFFGMLMFMNFSNEK